MAPILFILFINDIFNCHSLEMFNFADDTTIVAEDESIDRLHYRINEQLNKLFKWLCANKLKLNVEKSNFMVFTGNKKHSS